jgi:hypothetical protein
VGGTGPSCVLPLKVTKQVFGQSQGRATPKNKGLLARRPEQESQRTSCMNSGNEPKSDASAGGARTRWCRIDKAERPTQSYDRGTRAARRELPVELEISRVKTDG